MTEQYNGSSWTEVNDLNTERKDKQVWNLYAALSAAGYTTTWVDNVESWDGTNWTEIAE